MIGGITENEPLNLRYHIHKILRISIMQQITVEALEQQLATGKPLHVLDVREEDEYRENNIGGTLMPLSHLRNMDAAGIEDWKNEMVFVHCRSGQRSLQACMLLEQLGFTDTVNVQGGIMEWQKKFGDKKLA